MMNKKKAILARKYVDKILVNDACSKKLGIDLLATGVGWADMKMLITKEMVNGYDICHGGVIFTLADTTFACACNSYGQVTVALGCEIDFLYSAFTGDVLTAKGKERKRGGTTGVYDIEVFNQEEKLIALFRGKAFITDKTILE